MITNPEGTFGYATPDETTDVYSEFSYGEILEYVGEEGDFSVAGDQAIIDALGLSISRESANNIVQVNLKDANGNPVAGQVLNITFNDKNYSVATNPKSFK